MMLRLERRALGVLGKAYALYTGLAQVCSFAFKVLKQENDVTIKLLKT